MCLLYDESTRRLTESGFMEKPGIEPATPGLQDIGLSLTPRRLQLTLFSKNVQDRKKRENDYVCNSQEKIRKKTLIKEGTGIL